MLVRVDSINVDNKFLKSAPSEEKIKNKIQYYNTYHKFDKKILLDRGNNLLDGYINYLIAKNKGIEEVEVRYIDYYPCISGHHPDSCKTYNWRIPDKMLKKIKIGDLVICNTKSGVAPVYVTEIKNVASNESSNYKSIKRISC